MVNENLPRRTRLNVVQSKNGCLTCRERRIKCDEEKPTCLRCQRSQRICAGYVEPAQSTKSRRPGDLAKRPSIKVKLACSNLAYGIRSHSQHDRLARLGCEVLSNDPLRLRQSTNIAVWSHILPQLVETIPVVNAAVAAFGAYYEITSLGSKSSPAVLTATGCYGSALQMLQKDIRNEPDGYLPLVLSCLVLACSDIVQRNEERALIHLHGAFYLSSRQSLTNAAEAEKALDGRSDLMQLLRSLDGDTAAYTMPSPPQLPALHIEHLDHAARLHSVDEAKEHLVNLTHECYHFAAIASKFKYLPRPALPLSIEIDQGRLLSKLLCWLTQLESDIIAPLQFHERRLAGGSSGLAKALTLRTQCLATLIYLTVVTSPFETSYDQHSGHFQQIVHDVIRIIELHDHKITLPGQLHPFNIESSLFQPLFLTAVKYRHGLWRRRAITCLRQMGRQGPWCSSRHAAQARCVVEIEERRIRTVGLAGTEKDGGAMFCLPENILEEERVCGSWIADKADEARETQNWRIGLSRCRDVYGMVSGERSFEDPVFWDKFEVVVVES